MKKRCSKCKMNKALTEFYKERSKRDGLKSLCKGCCDFVSREWIKKNRENIKKQKYEYNRSEKGRAVKKKSRINYRRTKNGRQRLRLRNSKYQKTAKGKEASRRADSKRRSIFRDEKQAFTLTLDQWLQNLKFFKYRCAYCGKKNKKLVHEHVIPLERGGWDTRENVIPTCNGCNLLKGRKIPYFEWEPLKYLKKICSN